jgi:hypothetical protein
MEDEHCSSKSHDSMARTIHMQAHIFFAPAAIPDPFPNISSFIETDSRGKKDGNENCGFKKDALVEEPAAMLRAFVTACGCATCTRLGPCKPL